MAAHVLSVHANQCISDLHPSSSSSSLFIVFLTFPGPFQSVFLNLGEGGRLRVGGEGEGEVSSGEC